MKTTATPFLVLALSVPSALCAPIAHAQDAGSTYGHARTRALAELGRLPTPPDVAVADLVNFHRHQLPLPHAGEPVALDLRFGSSAVDADGSVVLQVGFATGSVGDRRELPPLNLGLVIDCSGSMSAGGKLDAVQRALRVLVDRLRPEDRIALVTYSNTAELRGNDRLGDGAWLRRAIDGLEPGGATNLHGGLMLGLREVAAHAKSGAHDRVILLTDGIANRGETDPDAILADARRFTEEDIDLATIGVGVELNTELLDRLARGARGMFHFVADAQDVQKVFVEELEAQLAAVARHVQLRLVVPPGLEVTHVFGFDARRSGRRELVVDLPDLNADATQIVVAECRVRDPYEDRSRIRVTAKLEFRVAEGGERRELEQSAVLDVRRAHREGVEDAEVRKNHAIARVAESLHEMAVSARDSRWVDADRSLKRGLEFAREQFPSGEDEDLRRVTKMAEDYRRVLRGYVDRFRDG